MCWSCRLSDLLQRKATHCGVWMWQARILTRCTKWLEYFQWTLTVPCWDKLRAEASCRHMWESKLVSSFRPFDLGNFGVLWFCLWKALCYPPGPIGLERHERWTSHGDPIAWRLWSTAQNLTCYGSHASQLHPVFPGEQGIVYWHVCTSSRGRTSDITTVAVAAHEAKFLRYPWWCYHHCLLVDK